MAYGKPLEKIKVKNQSIEQSVDKGNEKPAENKPSAGAKEPKQSKKPAEKK